MWPPPSPAARCVSRVYRRVAGSIALGARAALRGRLVGAISLVLQIRLICAASTRRSASVINRSDSALGAIAVVTDRFDPSPSVQLSVRVLSGAPPMTRRNEDGGHAGALVLGFIVYPVRCSGGCTAGNALGTGAP